ncbi:MAG: MFS transporter [Nocardioides sp.]
MTDGPLPHRAALVCACGVLFLTFLDTTIVSVTLASVQSDLHAGVSALQWVVNAYTLTFACLMLAAGALGDRIGHRRVMLAGLVVFVAGSWLAATATGVDRLILGRVVMGVGAAGSEPATLAVLRHLYPDARQRARAIGTWAATSGLGLALGPVLGGLLVGQWSWAAVFWFNFVAGILALVAVFVALPSTTVRHEGRVDLAGFSLSALALLCGVYGVIAGETAGYDSGRVLALFGASAVALVAFVAVERRGRSPMLDPAYLRIPLVRGALVVAFAVYFGIFSIFFFTALYLQEVLAYSGGRLAGLFAPMAGGIIAAAVVTGRWLASTRARIPMVLGCVLGAAGIFLARGLLDEHPRFVPLMLALVVAGAGFGMAVVPLTAVVLGAAPRDQAGLAAAMTNTMRQVGAVIGVATLGALVNAHLTSDLRHRLDALGVPRGIQGIVTAAIEQGDVPTNGAPQATSTYGGIVQRVIGATFGAFRDGLHQSLLVAGAMMLLAGAYAWVTTRPRR